MILRQARWAAQCLGFVLAPRNELFQNSRYLGSEHAPFSVVILQTTYTSNYIPIVIARSIITSMKPGNLLRHCKVPSLQIHTDNSRATGQIPSRRDIHLQLQPLRGIPDVADAEGLAAAWKKHRSVESALQLAFPQHKSLVDARTATSSVQSMQRVIHTCTDPFRETGDGGFIAPSDLRRQSETTRIQIPLISAMQNSLNKSG